MDLLTLVTNSGVPSAQPCSRRSVARRRANVRRPCGAVIGPMQSRPGTWNRRGDAHGKRGPGERRRTPSRSSAGTANLVRGMPHTHATPRAGRGRGADPYVLRETILVGPARRVPARQPRAPGRDTALSCHSHAAERPHVRRIAGRGQDAGLERAIYIGANAPRSDGGHNTSLFTAAEGATIGAIRRGGVELAGRTLTGDAVTLEVAPMHRRRTAPGAHRHVARLDDDATCARLRLRPAPRSGSPPAREGCTLATFDRRIGDAPRRQVAPQQMTVRVRRRKKSHA